MIEKVNIVQTAIVKHETDAFWNTDSKIEQLSADRSTVVISLLITSDAEKEQLDKMLSACKLALSDYHLIQLDQNAKLSWHKLREKLKPAHVLLLGIDTEQLGMNVYFMPHQTNRFDNTNFIPTLSLAGLQKDNNIKTHLWLHGLKPVFIDKIYS